VENDTKNGKMPLVKEREESVKGGGFCLRQMEDGKIIDLNLGSETIINLPLGLVQLQTNPFIARQKIICCICVRFSFLHSCMIFC
jgi:hypothetical protein